MLSRAVFASILVAPRSSLRPNVAARPPEKPPEPKDVGSVKPKDGTPTPEDGRPDENPI